MFTSDVSARGLDYPDVSLVRFTANELLIYQVIQAGAPTNKEQYIHRLGRTARAGKMGAGLLILVTYEEPFLKTVGLSVASSLMFF